MRSHRSYGVGTCERTMRAFVVALLRCPQARSHDNKYTVLKKMSRLLRTDLFALGTAAQRRPAALAAPSGAARTARKSL
jgi:hypothetical protein